MKKKIKIAVDAMGGENSPKKVLDAILENAKKNKDIFFNIFGDENIIKNYISKKLDNNIYKIHHTKNKILDTDTPLSAAKKGKDTSMWLTVESVKNKESDIAISAGNTGALFVIAKLNLKMIEKIDEKNLLDFSIMGASLYKSLYPNDEAKVALLNIGSEELKGNDVIKNAYQLLNEKRNKDFKFVGYIEGNNIMEGDVNVIVTDGFTGNIALKTAEGTANFIMNEFKKTMTSNILGKISALINISNLKKTKQKFDPRYYNGAILIGLTSPVVKSHGSTDYIGFSNSINVCKKIIEGDLIQKIKNNIN